MFYRLFFAIVAAHSLFEMNDGHFVGIVFTLVSLYAICSEADRIAVHARVWKAHWPAPRSPSMQQGIFRARYEGDAVNVRT